MIRPFPVILIGIGIVSIGAYIAITQYQNEPSVVFPLPDAQATSSVTTTSSVSPTSEPDVSTTTSSFASSDNGSPITDNTALPPSVHIDVPFASQAPLQNWDALHEESCEEASLILVEHYLNGKTVTPESMEAEIQKLVQWETDHGYKYDVDMNELKTIAADFYKLKGKIVTDVSVESMKKELAAGHPIIIPAAGQTLGNPYFSGDGPPYHVLVVIGYDSKNFITNDVGTRRGKDYKYDYQTLINAIHDWNGSTDTIESGRKVMLVVTK